MRHQFSRSGMVSRNALILLPLLLGGALVLLSPETGSAQKSEKKSWTEKAAGNIPKEFGQLVAFLGTKGNYMLVFRAEDGVVRCVDFNGALLPEQGTCTVFNRQ